MATPSGTGAGSPAAERTVSLLDEGAKAPVEMRVTPALAAAIRRAGDIRRQQDPTDQVVVTFGSLFLGLVSGSDPVGSWLQAQFRRAGDLGGLLARFGLRTLPDEKRATSGLRPVDGPLARSRSARAALDEAERFAGDLGIDTVDTRHVMAAYLSLPEYHTDDFRILSIDRVAWARDFAAEMAKRHPGERWGEFVASAFPQANAAADVAQSTAPRQERTAATEDLDLTLGGVAEPVVAALQEADALAGDRAISPSHVLQAVVNHQARPDSEAFRRFARLVPLKAGPPARNDRETDPGRLDARLRRQLVRAQRAQAGATAATQIWGRDLVTAALLSGDGAAATLSGAGRTLAEVRDAWFGYVTSTGDHRTPDDWRAWWNEAGVPVGTAHRTGVALETADGEDKLGIEEQARAFARLILDKKVEAPLSIGLLGDWGSGKSFFIRQIRKEVAAIRGRPRPELYSDPVEIEFNAWHASDANLWASLVTHIFDEIWEKVSPSAGASLDAAREELLRQIEQANGAVHAAEAQVAAGREALAVAEADLARRRSELGWNAYVRSVSREKLAELARRAGWDQPLETIAEVRAAAGSLSSSAVRLRHAVNELAARPLTTIALPTVVLATATVALWLLFEDPSFDAQLVRWAGSAAGVIGAVVAPLKLAGAKLGALAGKLEEIRKDYDERIDGLSAAEKEQVHRAQRELGLAEQGVERAKERLARLIAEQAASDPRRRLGEFLQDRVQSTVYRSQQGIISLVHKDFRKLSEYMRRVREAPPAAQSPAPEGQQGTAAPAIRPFDRIILYVDDLDRCRPQHVVHMLEAVHLLLALDLFIVVVAVDSRWLTRSLEVHYEELLGSREDEDRDDDDDVRASTPQNYLEKIFQITYALGPMDPTLFRDYVAALAGSVGGPTESGAAKTTARVGQGGIAAEDADEGAMAREPAAGGAESNAGSREETASEEPSGGEAEAEGDEEAQRADAADTPVVRIDEDEQKILCSLVPLLPTPRIAKRLVNVYRLIKATRTAAQREEFDRDGRAKSCLLVLSLLFGRPLIARDLLRGLQENERPFDDDARSLVDAVRSRGAVPAESPLVTTEWKRLAATLEAMKVTSTVGECAREVLVVARYSLVTGHDWHTWRR